VDGTQKKVTENYLVNALSFTECEKRIEEELNAYSQEFEIESIVKLRISELVKTESENADKWYKCKILSITFDEHSGKEKKIHSLFLVQGTDLNNAKNTFVEFMKGSMMDYSLVKIEESNILEVFEYQK